MPLELPAGDFRAFIFDCDGTLADNMPLHFAAWTRAMQDFGGSYPEHLFYEWGGVPTADIVHRLNDKFGLFLEVDNHAVVAIARAYHGQLPLAVASGGHRDLVERTLRALEIRDLFQTVIAAEDYQRGKPHPDPFLTAAARLRIEPEYCLVFEDTATGAEAARAAGMSWVLV
jgi:beta-phosphoglucomutase-like phosphatase (HAD superfamily)